MDDTELSISKFRLKPIADLRSHVIRHTFGALLLSYEQTGYMMDLQGAIESESYELCHVMGRVAVLNCCTVRSIAESGNLAFIHEDATPAYDPFLGMPSSAVEEALALIDECATAETGEQFNAWMQHLRSFVKATQQSLHLDGELADARSKEGLYSTIRLGRQWMDIVQGLGLPSLIPASWL